MAFKYFTRRMNLINKTEKNRRKKGVSLRERERGRDKEREIETEE